MPQTLDELVVDLARDAASRYYGKHRAVVTDNVDPQHLCRIKVQAPALMGETEIGWCLPAFPFLGDGHGLVMMPEVGSMVWLEFEAGKLDFPIWTGGFLSGKQKPPDPHDAATRVIVSKNGHKIILDDKGGKLCIEHSGGAKLEMSGTEISLTISGSKMVMGVASISFNEGVVKIGPGGVSLAQGAMTLGAPPT